MATVRNSKSKNNNTNLATSLSVSANGGTRFLELLDKDHFYIDPDGRNSILGKNDNDFEYAFTGKHHDYHSKFHKYCRNTLMVLRELVRQYENKYFVTFT